VEPTERKSIKKLKIEKIKIKTGQILRSSKILITMGKPTEKKSIKKWKIEN